MASSSQQQQQGDGQLKSISSSNSPACFFKIILQDTIRNGKLGIPIKFVKNHGNSMSSPALLRVPSGAVWKIELTKCDGKIWLDKGWLEFSNHYSLGFGHFLVFIYDGNSNFHVLIFEKSASEIQYRCAGNDRRRSNEILEQNINQNEDDDSIQIIEDFPTSRKKRKKSHLPCPRPHKAMRSTNSCQSSTSTDLFCPVKHKPSLYSRWQSLTALQIASAFRSENPSFVVVLHPSYAHSNKLSIPMDFVRKYLTKMHKEITLLISNGKSWPVMYDKNWIEMSSVFLRNGWRRFVVDKNLEVGDACVFELIKGAETSLQVTIYKKEECC